MAGCFASKLRTIPTWAGGAATLVIPLVVFFFAQRVFLKGIDLSDVNK